MKIKEIMKPAVTVMPLASRERLLSVAREHPNTELFIVVDKDRQFLGDIHENDLFYMLVPDERYDDIGVELGFDVERKFFAKTAGELMHKHDLSCTEDDDLLAVALTMLREDVVSLPVLDKQGVVRGYVTQGVIMRHLEPQ